MLKKQKQKGLQLRGAQFKRANTHCKDFSNFSTAIQHAPVDHDLSWELTLVLLDICCRVTPLYPCDAWSLMPGHYRAFTVSVINYSFLHDKVLIVINCSVREASFKLYVHQICSPRLEDCMYEGWGCHIPLQQRCSEGCGIGWGFTSLSRWSPWLLKTRQGAARGDMISAASLLTSLILRACQN